MCRTRSASIIAQLKEENQVDILEIRDAVFYWTGVWALFSLLDAALVGIAVKVHGLRRRNRRHICQSAGGAGKEAQS